MISLSFCC